ncbi:MAG: RnfABCDGE type electron transport complex subunit D [Desulfobacterales bacterium]|nr:RnfABCDGE type electron transport complex subunit D [Desulfobacterales bacterium]
MDPLRFASPAFHLLTGFTLFGAFFLATEDASSPVNFIPMLIYGASAGADRSFHTQHRRLRRRAGVRHPGRQPAFSRLLDKIRPKALGKVG